MTPSTILGVVLAFVPGYLLGSLNFAVIVSRLYAHDDVRRHGSGNAGMTNMLRTYGKFPALLTALGDIFKGTASVWIGRLAFALLGISFMDGGYLGGIAALLGHLFPLYFGFKGGKGGPGFRRGAAGHQPAEPVGSGGDFCALCLFGQDRLADLDPGGNLLPHCHLSDGKILALGRRPAG